MKSTIRPGLALAFVFTMTWNAHAQPPGMAGGMPSARQMSGIPMPMDDVPAGTVSVRVVKDELSNTLSNVEVRLETGGRVLTSKTNAEGIALFPGLPIGAEVHATATVNGERLDSQPFAVPSDHGIRILLVTGGGGGADAMGAATPGSGAPLSFGGQSRVQIEMSDDAVEVFYILELIVRGTPPAGTPAELVFRLPDEATQGSVLEGSSTQAQVRGTIVSISGPFQPGTLPIQIAYSLRPGGPERTIAQSFPIPLDALQVMAAKVGNLQMASPQFSNNGDTANAAGAFMIGVGPTVPAGTEITLSLSGLPTRNRAWRQGAIGLVVVILLVGAWASFSARPGDAVSARRSELEARRERLMADLVRLEEQRKSGATSDGRYAARRTDLTSQLERIYGELDRQGGPAAGDQGLVA